MQKDSQKQGAVVRRQKEKIQNGLMRIRSLKTRVGRECSISRQRDTVDCTVEVYMLEESEERVTVL